MDKVSSGPSAFTIAGGRLSTKAVDSSACKCSDFFVVMESPAVADDEDVDDVEDDAAAAAKYAVVFTRQW